MGVSPALALGPCSLLSDLEKAQITFGKIAAAYISSSEEAQRMNISITDVTARSLMHVNSWCMQLRTPSLW